MDATSCNPHGRRGISAHRRTSSIKYGGERRLNQLRRFVEFLIGLAAVSFAGSLPWIDFQHEFFELKGIRVVYLWLYIFFLLLFACATSQYFAWRSLLYGQWIFPTVFITLITVFSLSGFWYGYFLHDGLLAYEFRAGIQSVVYLIGLVFLTGAYCLSENKRVFRLVEKLRNYQFKVWQPLAFVIIGSAAVGYFVLGGMPHMHDAFEYLMQARILETGAISLDRPLHAELFAPHFQINEEKLFGKYPPGWPALLAMFDVIRAPWLANAVVAAGVVLATFTYVRGCLDRRAGLIASFVLAFTPWLHWQGASQLSHLASTLWLVCFLIAFEKLRAREDWRTGVIAGLFLGAGVLTRPQDAIAFALPCVILSVIWLLKDFRRWFPRLMGVVAGVLPGIGLYLAYNANLTGGLFTTTYGGTPAAVITKQSPGNLVDLLVWLHESWVGLSREWFAGVLPAALPVAIGLWFGRRHLKRLSLLLACSASLFLFYGAFIMGSRTWFGPRWYAPLVPGVAAIITCGLLITCQSLREPGLKGRAARTYVGGIVLALAVCWGLGVPLRILSLVQQPPHGADTRVATAVREANLTNAVVALERYVSDRETGEFRYKALRSGLWTMRLPFEINDVIYVAAVPDWAEKASENWPNRKLYRISLDPGAFELVEIHGPQKNTQSTSD